jgi:hypothetical protein
MNYYGLIESRCWTPSGGLKKEDLQPESEEARILSKNIRPSDLGRISYRGKFEGDHINGREKDIVTINSFIEGIFNRYSPWEANTHVANTYYKDANLIPNEEKYKLVIRGLGPESLKAMNNAIKSGNDFYFCDNDYLMEGSPYMKEKNIEEFLRKLTGRSYSKYLQRGIGRGRGFVKSTYVTRITKNKFFQNELYKCDLTGDDKYRLNKRKSIAMAGVQKWQKEGGHILVCPTAPILTNSKYKDLYKDHPLHATPDDVESWIQKTVLELKKYTDRKIVIRIKPNLKDEHIPFADDIQGAHACVTMCSKVAIDSVMMGIPSFCDPLSMAAPVSRTDLSQIENPLYADNREKWIETLLLNQFTIGEIISGIAWDWLVRQ